MFDNYYVSHHTFFYKFPPFFMPKISVLMPVYNTPEKYLREAIESILNQSYGDFEFIIVNDGSTNNVEEVILSYGDDRIRYYSNGENRGVTATRNRLVALSTGEYLALMDSDDVSLPLRFAKQVEFLDSHREVGVLGTWIEFFPERKVVIRPTESDLMKQYLLFSGSPVMNPTVMMRRSLKVYYNEAYHNAEDYILWLEIMDKTEFANLPEVLLWYRWHGENLSKRGQEEQEQCALMARRRMQGKYFGRDDSCVQRLADQDDVKWDDLRELLPFLRLMGEHAQEHGSGYRRIISKTYGGMEYLSFLWKDDLNDLMKVRFRHKCIYTLKILVQTLK